MNIVDLIILLLAATAIFRGVREGLLQQGLSLGGFFLGLFLGSFIARHVVSAQSTITRLLLTITITLGMAAILSSIGEGLGMGLRGIAERAKLHVIDKILGAVLQIASVLAVAWLSASVLTQLPSYNVSHAVRTSAIISFLNAQLPPAPNVIAGLEHLIDPNGFPKVFVGNEPNLPPVTPATTADARAAMDHAGASTVKIKGQGCGGIVEGSGFIAGDGLVITNAHVVAGIPHMNVIDTSGAHPAQPVLFDPNLDIAVLKVDRLTEPVLPISADIQPRGTATVALGFPGDGGLTASPAGVLGTTNALGRNIYNEGLTSRDIYQLSADINPGNSGGPLVLPNGTVVGVVFAKSTTDANVGYALTAPAVIHDLQQVSANSPAVDTGTCAE